MAVPAANLGMVGIPLNPRPHANGSQPVAHNGRGDIEVRGSVLRHPTTVARVAARPIGFDADETMRALRLLALDNLISIVELRERLSERDAQVTSLAAELQQWRSRALTESALRKTEAARARHHERELVTVLHRQMIDIDTLSAELGWRRQPWYRRPSARRASAKRTPSTAPR